MHFLQIWIKPSYEQKVIPEQEKQGKLYLIASEQGRNSGATTIHADANVYASILDDEQSLTYEPPAGRHTWIQVARGKLSVNGQLLEAGDGTAIGDEGLLALKGEGVEIIIFDLL